MYPYSKIHALFIHAATEIKFPRLIYHLPNDQRIQFTQTQDISNKWYRHIWISDGGRWPNRRNYARIHPNCQDIYWYPDTSQAMHELIERILADPEHELVLNGKQYSYCCFCGTEITSPNSLFYGYGPICAANWGLPWEDGAEQAKQQATEDELEKVWKINP